MPTREQSLSELRSALAHLDDPPYLENHPLAQRISFIAEAPALSRGQLLRRTLRLAIEALDPGAEALRDGPEARSYEVLHRYAIARQSMVAIAAKLDISERQAYRELRRALEALEQVLSELASGSANGLGLFGKAPTPAAKVREEVERLSRGNSQEVDIAQLVIGTLESAQCLAQERAVEIRLVRQPPSLIVTANRVMLRQAVLNLLSHMVSVAAAGGSHTGVEVAVERVDSHAVVQMTYGGGVLEEMPPSESPYAVAAQLLDSLGIRWTQETTAQGVTRVSLPVPLAREHKVLVVDDNEGIIALFRCYLRHQPYRVLGATSAEQALALLDTERPDLVILDVMMPDRDGWEVLQAMRARPAGAKARVIVCSIINDPHLAAASGANGFLHKPVDQARLVQALERVMKEG